jgi:GT2 family glycosyltransferase
MNRWESRPGVQTLAVPPRLTIVIVSYNCRSVLEECLESLPRGAGALTYETVVVDNDSRDGTAAWLAETRPDVAVIKNTGNAGFARACNQGAACSRAEYVLFLNPDTVAGDGVFEKTLDYMASTTDLAACGCKVLRPDGTLDLSCKRNFPSAWDALCRMGGLSRLFPRSRIFARYDARYVDEEQRQEVALIDGCYMMVRRYALQDIGPFDERFFMYAEEMDWCRRAWARGWSIGYDPTGTIVHLKGETTRRSPFRMLYHFHRSMALYCAKHYRPWNPILLVVYPGIVLRLAALTFRNLMAMDKRVSA